MIHSIHIIQYRIITILYHIIQYHIIKYNIVSHDTMKYHIL